LSALGVFWAIMFATLLPRADAARKAGFPRQGHREGTVIATGVAMVSLFLDVLVNILGIAKGVSS
jgi:hypothetical protein